MENIINPEQSELEVRSIETITTEILFFKQTAGMAILEIGKRLIEAKAQLPHGEWLPWLTEKVDFSERSAQNFMRLAEEYKNPQTVADLGASKALVLLALEPVEREEFIDQKHEVDGVEKTVSEMSKRELEAAVKAQKKAEAAAEDLKARLEEKTADYDALVKRAQKEVNELTEELEQVRKSKQDVVEVVKDTAEIEALTEKLKNKTAQLEKLEGKIREKDLTIQAAREAAEHQKAALKRAVEAENRERIRAVKLEKQLEASGKDSFAEFKLYFEQAKTSINKMIEISQQAAADGDAEAANKTRLAIKAMLDKTLDIVDAMPAAEPAPEV